MKAIRVRTVLFVALLMISSLSWLTYVIVYLIETKSLHIGTREPSRVGVWIAMSMGVLSAAAVFGYGLHRWIVKPLEAVGKAARQIAEGDLDIAIPPMGIREIADVKNGFDLMVRGLGRSLEKQSALEEERRFFIGSIAHDLRTPLFALKGYLEGLDRGIAATPEQMDHYVKVCIQKSNQLDRLVTDLITFAKTEYMENLNQEEPIEVVELLSKSVETLRHLAETKMITFYIEAPPKGRGSGTILGDVYLLERAFNNLLDNAVRYIPSHGVIWVSCSFAPDRVTITIRDSGPGIPESDLGQVFEPLYRGESSRNRESGGTGLGLTIAKRIFRAHGGELKAGNHPEGGAMVTGWFPDKRDTSG
ncbi:sensor histidine kinase [Paenibacillus rigui]|uniref:histidine kinase n=1 Tax=Paenibacillus rigui TaxID=554312 RepID=A0A229UUK7_9BACL|nr:HAMP domain-containing sensor histidine kinase [Paenibacillus rigui]OXM87088.1 two-component sensor histidine kinase [Paenibacillus rigui]